MSADNTHMRNNLQAFRTGVTLAITAPTDELAAECLAMAEQAAAELPAWAIEQCQIQAHKDAFGCEHTTLADCDHGQHNSNGRQH